MGLENLSSDEKKIVFDSLNAAVNGPFFPRVFQTLVGFDKSFIIEIISKWSTVEKQNKQVERAINSVLLQLTFYPHDMDDELYRHIHISKEKLKEVFFKFKGIEPWPAERWDGVVKGYLVPKAQAVWDRFDKEKQQRLLTTVWCKNCKKETTITNYEGAIDIYNRLTIRGKCVECFKEVEISEALE